MFCSKCVDVENTLIVMVNVNSRLVRHESPMYSRVVSGGHVEQLKILQIASFMEQGV